MGTKVNKVPVDKPVPQVRPVFKVFQVLMVPLVPQVRPVLKVQMVPQVTEVHRVLPVLKADLVTMDRTVQLVHEVSEVCQAPPVPEVVWEMMPVKKNMSGKKFELSLITCCTRKLQVEALGTNTSVSAKLFIFMMLSSLA